MSQTRVRIGLIVPSGNTLSEEQFQTFAPASVRTHATRMRMRVPGRHESLDELLARIAEAAGLLADAGCDVVVFHCTAESMEAGQEGGRRMTDAMKQAGCRRATTTAEAVLAAFEAIEARKVVLLSPYARPTHEHEIEFLTKSGIEVVGGRTLEVPREVGYASVPSERWLQATTEEASAEADAYFLSCTNTQTMSVIEPIERQLGRPAVTSNQATLWHCLRSCGLDDQLPGLGRLFQRRAAALPL